ncbi:hypothetical protein EJ05DRAFT_520088 [Pseudovirgaria hyperparasitica]|uniref:Phytase-like domain-containing protein n=1 Tax=Pseudovirgaria hyperparasitica TaxID=470096 RepID=A0A6A6VX38_9PEZI|nr:uncharacterized protein EJ05DRAFT_520088 [Pseudovirgaria hyperparasitica]KAF2754745.1 hypothetical protein EJ05DRAFT_520088 [Pseudovirgaria hyperparasitica]
MVNFKGVAAALALGAAVVGASPARRDNATTGNVKDITCNGKAYSYKSLAGYGLIKANAVDKYGDTLGGIGSSIAIEKGSWKKNGDQYEGIVWTLPDRGWNTQGTINYQNRVHKFQIHFTPAQTGSPNLQLTYLDSVLFTGPTGEPTTGLDADPTGSLQYPGFPDLPVATYPGDGYANTTGPGDSRIALDAEGLVLTPSGFWVSDEYGPRIYHFDRSGRMTAAIAPPAAFTPLRNNTASYASDNPPLYDSTRTLTPTDPQSGRANNQGFEGLTLSADGNTLSVLVQSALIQEGGTSKKDGLQARFLQYDVSISPPAYLGENIVSLPQYTNNEGKKRVAAQSEILAISASQYLVLARDGAGRGADYSESLYRHVDVFDISSASNIKGDTYDKTGGAIADKDGNLKKGLKAATYCSFLDFNVNSELAKFGLHNGGAQDDGLLNEKWESLALAPVLGEDKEEYFLFSFSDNDFITTDGHLNFGKYAYADKTDLNNQALVFRVSLPKGTQIYGF